MVLQSVVQFSFSFFSFLHIDICKNFVSRSSSLSVQGHVKCKITYIRLRRYGIIRFLNTALEKYIHWLICILQGRHEICGIERGSSIVPMIWPYQWGSYLPKIYHGGNGFWWLQIQRTTMILWATSEWLEKPILHGHRIACKFKIFNAGKFHTFTLHSIKYPSWFLRNMNRQIVFHCFFFFKIRNNLSFVKSSIYFASSTQKPLVLKPKPKLFQSHCKLL